MRAIVNGKLYDTEKASFVATVSINNFSEAKRAQAFVVYKTNKGNIFAIDYVNSVIIDGDQLKKDIEGKADCVDAYIEIFGMPEEA